MPPTGRHRGESWSDQEIALIVADYFEMLAAELRGEPVNKAGHNRELQTRLAGRSHSSIEAKHQNISAVLHLLHVPFIDGYKPLKNFQRALIPEIQSALGRIPSLQTLMESQSNKLPSAIEALLPGGRSREVSAPERIRRLANEGVRDRATQQLFAGPRDYAEQDRQNRMLGLRGEEFILEEERAKLVTAGARALASQIRHVSREDGDAAGYDIRSFTRSGRLLLIEVKTTNHNKRFPFIVTKNELETSRREAQQYCVYRLFQFSRDARYFRLPGPIDESADLEPRTFRALL